MTDISKYDDVIDSRDVIERIAELEIELEDAFEQFNEGREIPLTKEQWLESDAFEQYDDSELTTLQALQEEAEGYAPDWQHGCVLVRDSHFKDYAEELAEDCGMIQAGATWPNNCIDWDEAARQLKFDYTSVEFDGVTYWVR